MLSIAAFCAYSAVILRDIAAFLVSFLVAAVAAAFFFRTTLRAIGFGGKSRAIGGDQGNVLFGGAEAPPPKTRKGRGAAASFAARLKPRPCEGRRAGTKVVARLGLEASACEATRKGGSPRGDRLFFGIPCAGYSGSKSRAKGRKPKSGTFLGYAFVVTGASSSGIPCAGYSGSKGRAKGRKAPKRSVCGDRCILVRSTLRGLLWKQRPRKRKKGTNSWTDRRTTVARLGLEALAVRGDAKRRFATAATVFFPEYLARDLLWRQRPRKRKKGTNSWTESCATVARLGTGGVRVRGDAKRKFATEATFFFSGIPCARLFWKQRPRKRKKDTNSWTNSCRREEKHKFLDRKPRKRKKSAKAERLRYRRILVRSTLRELF